MSTHIHIYTSLIPCQRHWRCRSLAQSRPPRRRPSSRSRRAQGASPAPARLAATSRAPPPERGRPRGVARRGRSVSACDSPFPRGEERIECGEWIGLTGGGNLKQPFSNGSSQNFQEGAVSLRFSPRLLISLPLMRCFVGILFILILGILCPRAGSEDARAAPLGGGSALGDGAGLNVTANATACSRPLSRQVCSYTAGALYFHGGI